MWGATRSPSDYARLLIFYGGGDPTAVPPVQSEPTAETRAAAQEQLARLVVAVEHAALAIPLVPRTAPHDRRTVPAVVRDVEAPVFFRSLLEDAPAKACSDVVDVPPPVSAVRWSSELPCDRIDER